MEGLQYNINYLASTYGKEVCIVETAYAWTTEDGDGVGNGIAQQRSHVAHSGTFVDAVNQQLAIVRGNIVIRTMHELKPWAQITLSLLESHVRIRRGEV